VPIAHQTDPAPRNSLPSIAPDTALGHRRYRVRRLHQAAPRGLPPKL